MNVMNSGKPAAARDRFTAGFLNTEKQPKKGFYTFYSKVNNYSMYFPEDYEIAKKDYKSKDGFEYIPSNKEGGLDKDEPINRYMAMEFMSGPLSFASIERLSYKGKYRKIEGAPSGNEIYVGSTHLEIDVNNPPPKHLDPEKYGPSRVYVVVHNAKLQENVELAVNMVCKNGYKCPKIDLKKEEAFAIEIAKSVKFRERGE